MTPITQPMVVFDEKRAINRVAIWVALARHRLGAEWSREWLGTTLRRYLRGIEISDGVRLSIAIEACKAADAGDEIADAALWDVGRELIERPTGRPGDLQILAYYQRAGRHSPRRRRGRQWHDDWYRNLCICLLVELACKEFGVRPTRNRESRRGGREPSGCSLVAAGLARNKDQARRGDHPAPPLARLARRPGPAGVGRAADRELLFVRMTTNAAICCGMTRRGMFEN